MSEIDVVELESIEEAVNTQIKIYIEEFKGAQESERKKSILIKMLGLSSFISTLGLNLRTKNPNASQKMSETERNILKSIEDLWEK